MTKNQLESHNEQMEAHRAEFQKAFEPTRRQLKKDGLSPHSIAMVEMSHWKFWIGGNVALGKVVWRMRREAREI